VLLASGVALAPRVLQPRAAASGVAARVLPALTQPGSPEHKMYEMEEALIRAGVHAALGFPAGVAFDQVWMNLRGEGEDEPCGDPLERAGCCMDRMWTRCRQVVSCYVAETISPQPSGECEPSQISEEPAVPVDDPAPACPPPAIGPSCPRPA